MCHLVRLNQLLNKNYHEFLPGVLTKGYRNTESVYIEDDQFVFLTPAIKNEYEPYQGFNRYEIPKECWIRIIGGLVIIKEYLYNQKTAELSDYIQPVFMTQTEKFLYNYLENNVLIVELFNELITWLEEQLIKNEYITLIGL